MFNISWLLPGTVAKAILTRGLSKTRKKSQSGNSTFMHLAEDWGDTKINKRVRWVETMWKSRDTKSFTYTSGVKNTFLFVKMVRFFWSLILDTSIYSTFATFFMSINEMVILTYKRAACVLSSQLQLRPGQEKDRTTLGPMYTALPQITLIGCFGGLNPWPPGHTVATYTVGPKLP